MRRIGIVGVALLVSACTSATPVSVTPASVAPACTGGANDPAGCVAKVSVGEVTYQDWGLVAFSDAGRAELVASGILTTSVTYPASPGANGRIDSADHDSGVNYAGLPVWNVPGIDPGHLILLGPFPQTFDSNLYEMFLAPAGSQDVPLELCSHLKPSKINPPLVCQPVPQTP